MTSHAHRRLGGGAVVGVLVAAAIAALWLSLGVPGSAALEMPALSSRVTDLASMLSPAARERLERKLRGLETRTGAQVAVLTIPSLEGESLEAYSVRVAQAWGLGRKGVDDGVLFLVAKNDRKMRLEVGYGLEPKLTDAFTREILDERVRPRFRANDFEGGIEAGADAVVATIEGTPLAATAPRPRRESGAGRGTILFMGGIFTLVIGLHSLVAILNPTAMGWFLYVFLMPFYAAFPSFMFPPYGGAVACGAWIILSPSFATGSGLGARSSRPFIRIWRASRVAAGRAQGGAGAAAVAGAAAASRAGAGACGGSSSSW